jgi:hypothetical protein
MKIDRVEVRWRDMAGALQGEMHRGLGTFPDVATIRIPSTQFVPWEFGNEEQSWGDLELRTYFDDGMYWPIVVTKLYAHDLAWTREYVGGTATGQYEVAVTLKDRRWRWDSGHVTGEWNVPTEDGKGVRAGTARTLAALIMDCLTALGEDPNVIPIPEGGDADPPDGPHVEWAFESARAELERLLEYGGYVLALNLDGTVHIWRTGDGLEPVAYTERPQFRVPSELTTMPTWRPTQVVVTTAPRRVRDEVTLPGPWEAVGEETDGRIIPIDQLSYTPGEGWLSAAAKGFDSIPSDECRTLASKCVLKWFRIPPGNDAKLPLLEDRTTIVDGVRAKAKVWARYAFLHKGTKTWRSSEGEPPINWQLDQKVGIIKFGRPCACISKDGVLKLEETEFVSPYVQVTFGFEVRNPAEPDSEYYCYTAGTPGRERVISLPTGTLYRIEGVDQNKAELDAIAERLAARILAEPASREQGARVIFGYWDVNCNGNVVAVRWMPRWTTEYELRSEPPGPSTYLQRRSSQLALRNAETALRSTLAEADATGVGSGRRARADEGESSFEPDVAEAPAGFVRYEQEA